MFGFTAKVLAAAVVAATVTAPVAKAEFINIATGGTSGVYYPLGVALSELYSQDIKGARVQVQATKASVENLNLLGAKKAELAFSIGDLVKYAWDGNKEAGFPKPLTDLRALASIYSNYIQIVAEKELGIKTIYDLKGKTLSVGAPASGTELNAREIFKAAGMTYDDLGKVEYLPYAESAELIKNNQLQATLQSSGLGVAFIKDLASSHDITIVAIPKEVVEKIGAPYVPAVIPAGTYQGQTEDIPTAAISNMLVTRAGVSDETAYQMTKLLFENLPKLQAAHSAAKAISVEHATDGLSIPLHPGAEKYYREVGVLK